MNPVVVTLQIFVALLLLFSTFQSNAHAQGLTGASGTAGGVNLNTGQSACRFVSINQGACISCFQGGGAWTAIGCVGSGGGFESFVDGFIKIGIGLGSGIAFLLILLSGFQQITSAGNPERIHEAKELMTAAISGLLLIIFSVFLLRLIGVNILQIPGFS